MLPNRTMTVEQPMFALKPSRQPIFRRRCRSILLNFAAWAQAWAAKTLVLTGINLCSSRGVFVPALVAKRRHLKAWDASPRRETILASASREATAGLRRGLMPSLCDLPIDGVCSSDFVRGYQLSLLRNWPPAVAFQRNKSGINRISTQPQCFSGPLQAPIPSRAALQINLSVRAISRLGDGPVFFDRTVTIAKSGKQNTELQHSTNRWRLSSMLRTGRTLALVLGLIGGFASNAESAPPDQTTDPPASDSELPASDSEQAASAAEQTSGTDPKDVSDAEISEWIEALGSNDFALREQAATRLIEIGAPTLAKLQQLSSDARDPEVRLRAQQIVMQLTRSDLKLRIKAFLAGQDVQFEGWRNARPLFGDSIRARELFIAMLESHPELTASLDGVPRDRAMALKKVVNAVKQRIFVERQSPRPADVFALLLPAADPDVPLEGGFEDVLIQVLYKQVVKQLLDDAQLSRSFTRLLGLWYPRSTLENREDILFLGMNSGIRQICPLARQTLSECNEPEAIVLAFQAIARFGDQRDTAVVVTFFDDPRPVGDQSFAGGKTLRARVSDVAMATIARLYDVPLDKVGFVNDSFHEKFAFVISELGFPVDDDEARKSARKKIDQLLAPPVPPKRS